MLTLPRLDATLVNGIVERSPFKTMLHMASVDAYLRRSLSKDQLLGLYARLFLPLNLNTATRRDILFIPGVDARLAHEFESHRPYRTLAQFRSEMEKYLEAKEVARLEQGVFIPIKLNTASDEEIETIPGLGPCMVREFESHRPYQGFARFRQEDIRKFVSDK